MTKPTNPPLRLWMVPVASFAKRENVPKPVKLSMLTEKVLPTEHRWFEIPNPHTGLYRVYISQGAEDGLNSS